MPTISYDPALTILGTNLSSKAACTITKIAMLCGASSLNFSCSAVLGATRDCMEQALSSQPSAKELISELLVDLHATLEELKAQGMVDPSKVPGFPIKDQPIASLLSRIPHDAPKNFMETLGNLLISSYLTSVKVSSNRTKRLQVLSAAIRKQPQLSAEQIEELQTLLRGSRKNLLETLTQALVTKDQKILKFNAELLIHLRSDLNSEHLEAQQCANPRAYFEKSNLIRALNSLSSDMLDGSCEALIALIAFSLNLSWDMTLKVPISRSAGKNGAILWIDADRGFVCLHLSQLLHDLGGAVSGCKKVNDDLRLNLSSTVTLQLLRTLRLNPSANALGDLIESKEDRAHSLTEYWSHSDRAKLIRSAPPTALDIFPSRAVVAYSFLAFNLLTKPDLPYITISEEQVWSMRSRLFETVGLGWGECHNLSPQLVGSKRTPEVESLQSILAHLKSEVVTSKVSRRYSLSNLINHHNKYVMWVAMYLQLTSGCRAQTTLEFVASSWFPGSPFGYLDDKNLGAAGGKTPIPISPQTSRQLNFFFHHLRSLKMRLEKILGLKARGVCNIISMVLSYQCKTILFFLSEECDVLALESSLLFTGPAQDLTHDFGRHFFGTAFTEAGETLASLHYFLRHQGEGINPQSAAGVCIHSDQLLNASLSIDAILNQLGIHPLAGLVGGES